MLGKPENATDERTARVIVLAPGLELLRKSILRLSLAHRHQHTHKQRRSSPHFSEPFLVHVARFQFLPAF